MKNIGARVMDLMYTRNIYCSKTNPCKLNLRGDLLQVCTETSKCGAVYNISEQIAWWSARARENHFVTREMLRRAASTCFRKNKGGAMKEPAWTSPQQTFINSTKLFDPMITMADHRHTRSKAVAVDSGEDECYNLRILTSTWLGEKRREDVGFQPNGMSRVMAQIKAGEIDISTPFWKGDNAARIWKLLPERAPYPPGHFKRCAIVGGSGLVNRSQYGRDIDRDYDAVFRVNDGPSIGQFGCHVGRRADFRITNSMSKEGKCAGDDGSTPTHISKKHGPFCNFVAWEGTVIKAEDVDPAQLAVHSRMVASLSSNSKSQNGSLLVDTDQSAYGAPDNDLPGEHHLPFQLQWFNRGPGSAPNGNMGTGRDAMILASGMCRKMHLYGFGMELKDTEAVWTHYYRENINGVMAEGHNIFGSELYYALLDAIRVFRWVF
jgi:hypothetical protein